MTEPKRCPRCGTRTPNGETCPHCSSIPAQQAADLAAYLSHTEPLTEQAAQNAGADLQQRQGIWQGVTPPQTPAPRH